jgi:glycosyltransferase involved in cell wall biosynthesis
VRVSIVIPAFNEERLIGDSLRAIQSATQSFGKRNWESEIIVCDNNSTDRTAEIARAAGAIVVFEPQNQIARARNCGAAAAKGDWLIFVDADSHPSAELFDDVAREIESGRCLAGGSTVILDGNHRHGKWITRIWNGISRVMRWMAGSFIFVEARAFKKVGGFNNELFVSEELDLSKRLKQLARAEKKEIVILHRHPLVTSARKLSLYSTREHLVFLGRTVLARGNTMRRREQCPIWYDGRR